MKSMNTTLFQALLATLAWPAAHAMALPVDKTRCEFEPIVSANLKVHVRDLNTVYVPRDARIGTPIGTPELFEATPDQNNLALLCRAYGERVTIKLQAPRGAYPPLPMVDGRRLGDPILRTNIQGIGVIVEMLQPFMGQTDQFIPDRMPPMVPFSAHYEQTRLGPATLASFRHKITLVKTGDLPPGEHQVDGVLVTGHLDWGGLGKVLEYTLRAKVIQTQCDATADVSANPVNLGEWNVNDFTGPGFTTPPAAFQVRLSNCQVDPDPGNETLATIELDGINGSRPIGPADENVFSLTDDSQARGIGIQMLYNGVPMPLNKEIELFPLTSGYVPLNFHARFYQTEANSNLRPGSAKGALNFTIRYR